MRLLSLSLEQYRNYERLELDFTTNDLHLIVGPNGTGKTNVLEAISLLSLTKSFLGLEEDDVRQWGTEFYRVKAQVRTDAGETEELEVVSQNLPRRQKVCFHNGVKIPLAQMVGRLPVVTFLPQELEIFSGPPAERRRFLDQILCQVSPGYFTALMAYQKVLKQRNALLKAISEDTADQSFLAPWDLELASLGSSITMLRLELVGTFTMSLTQEVRALGESWERAHVRYARSGTGCDRDELQREILDGLARTVDRDIILRSTSVGPHRDDWSVEADGRSLMTFASRGQKRVTILALLLLQASYLEVRRGEKPVILLDDIFSELDAVHRERLLGTFTDHQVILTATDLPVSEGAFPGAVRYTPLHA